MAHFLKGNSCCNDLLEVLVLLSGNWFWKQRFTRFTDYIITGLFQHLLAVIVDIDHVVIFVDDIDEILGSLSKGTIPLFALPECLLRPLPLGYIKDAFKEV